MKFFKNGKEMIESDYESFGDMVSQSDYVIIEEELTLKQIKERYEQMDKRK